MVFCSVCCDSSSQHTAQILLQLTEEQPRSSSYLVSPRVLAYVTYADTVFDHREPTARDVMQMTTGQVCYQQLKEE